MMDIPPLEFDDIDLSSADDRISPWLDTYIKYASAISPMTPTIFHESAALWMVSTIIARRLVLHASFGDIYPNLFICWLAPTTIWKKTTSLNIARHIMLKHFPFLISPQDMTPESFLSDLSGRKPVNLEDMTDEERALWSKERDFCAQRGIVLDELSSLMANSGKDYNAGLLETYLRLHDCDDHYQRSTRGQGRINVHNAYLSIIGASTPSAMSIYLKRDDLWAIGWWPRFVLLTPENNEPEWKDAQNCDEPAEITRRLYDLDHTLPPSYWQHPPTPVNYIITSDAQELWARYMRRVGFDIITDQQYSLDDRLNGTYGRLTIYAIKVAMLLSALEYDSEKHRLPIIAMQHMIKAISITESWRRSVHKVLDEAMKTDFQRIEQFVLTVCERHDAEDGASLRDLRNASSYDPRDIENAIAQLSKQGIIEAYSTHGSGKVGRPTIKYRLIKQ